MSIDENKLTDTQVKWLIRIIKRPVDLVQLKKLDHRIANKQPGAIRENVKLTGEGDFQGFTLFFNCDDLINKDLRYSMHIRFTHSNIQFVRLDVDGLHINPDGHHVTSAAHLHVYTPKYRKHDAVAMEVNQNYFKNVFDVYTTWREFLRLVNVVFEEASHVSKL